MLKVMIVDDEIIVRVGFQSCINWEAYGCQVVSTCESGGDAVEYMNRDVPDIVFTDIMMPGMDGIQLVKYISENHPDTKVVVLSCVDEIDYVKKAIKLGAEDYILKLSFTQDTLVELITRLKSMIEEERKKAGRGSLDMRVQSFILSVPALHVRYIYRLAVFRYSVLPLWKSSSLLPDHPYRESSVSHPESLFLL